MGSQDLTDGVWVWPEGLAHYVSAHSVRLPEMFLEQARNHRYKVTPQQLAEPHPEADGEFGVYDFELWRRWSAANSHPL
jgi:hypothetical protein